MNVTIDDLGSCKVLLRFELGADEVEAEFASVSRDFQRQCRIPGFRKGKAPMSRVVSKFGKEIKDEVRHALFSRSMKAAIKEHNLEVLGAVDFEEIQFERGQDFQFTATLELSPQFELPEYKGIPVQIEGSEVTDADMERAMNALREQRGTYEMVERPIQTGDFAIVNYRGTCEGKPITEISPNARGLSERKEFWINIKPDSFIPGFAEQLVGAQVGETRHVRVRFPEKFVVPELVGKEGEYEVEVVQVKERRLPELDDAFAQSYEAENMEALRRGVREDLAMELRQTNRRKIRDQMVQYLLDRVNFEVPASVLENETRNVVYNVVQENQQRGISQAAIEEKRDQIYAYASNSAKDRVKTTFLLLRVAQKEKLAVDKQELGRQIAFLAHSHNVPVRKYIEELKESNGINQIHEQMLVNKALDFMESHADIRETGPQETPPETAAETPADSQGTG